MTKKLPLFYFAPTICWVDDDQLFLDAAKNLFEKNYNFLSFNDSIKALEFLTSQQPIYSKLNFARESIDNEMNGTCNHFPIDINISEIFHLANTPSLQNEISILIIDNNMPHLNGIDICHKLKNSSYKKILLTGQTTSSEIIDAFNHRIIDKFIAKDQFISDTLQKNILELNCDFFYEITKNLLAHLETSRPLPLSDPFFINFFYTWCETNKIKEFYLINRHGSFLAKDNNGFSTYFIVMSEYEKNEFIKLHDDAMDKVGNLLLQVSQEKIIPFFGIGKESWEFSCDDWDKYFYPANILRGREKYYWTTITNEEK